MNEKPILFSAPMVRAILDGRKTQTRRIIKKAPSEKINHRLIDCNGWNWQVDQQGIHPSLHRDIDDPLLCGFGSIGDRLWVRETWRGVVLINSPGQAREYGVARYIPDEKLCKRIDYRATQEPDGEPWKPSIHMPRWASRINLEITGIRVERLQDISDDDAWSEGIDEAEVLTIPSANAASAAYSKLWESINGKGSWDKNPWVWVIEFKMV